MRWTNWRRRHEQSKQWHPWFAWRPVELGYYGARSATTVWLQWIERRYSWSDPECGTFWDYKDGSDMGAAP